MNVQISNIEYYLPSKVESFTSLSQDNPNWEIDKIFKKTGISQRFISEKNQTAADLAFLAASKLLNSDLINQIDLLILVTQSPDYFLPSSSCILQFKLGINTKCMSFDINLGCSGFVYALGVASSLIESNIAKKSLILCSDTYSKYITQDDRTCRPIFSDGASAILVEKNIGKYSMGPFEFGTDGSGYDDLIVSKGASRNPSVDDSINAIKMNGSSVLLFTLSKVPSVVLSLLKKANLTIDSIDMFFFHQASKFVIDNLIESLAINKGKVFINYQNIGNTVSSSIPIALKDAHDSGTIKAGDKLMLIGFGVGLSWGATLIEWSVE